MSDTRPWYAKYEAAKTREAISDWWLQVRAKFQLPDYWREALSTVSRGYVIWMVFLVIWNLVWGVIDITNGEVSRGVAYLIIGALFGIQFLDRLTINMAEKIIQSLLSVNQDQHKLLTEILDERGDREFD
jgi:hypothetical protein